VSFDYGLCKVFHYIVSLCVTGVEEIDDMIMEYTGSVEKLLGSIREPHGTHTGNAWTSWLFCIEIPEGTRRVLADLTKTEGFPLGIPCGYYSIPDGSLKGTDWCHSGVSWWDDFKKRKFTVW